VTHGGHGPSVPVRDLGGNMGGGVTDVMRNGIVRYDPHTGKLALQRLGCD